MLLQLLYQFLRFLNLVYFFVQFFLLPLIGDKQLLGFGVDGQYIKMGVLNKLIEKINLDEKDLNKLKGWILQAWELTHNLNLTDMEVGEKSDLIGWLDSLMYLKK